jgi:hypothetical protein
VNVGAWAFIRFSIYPMEYISYPHGYQEKSFNGPALLELSAGSESRPLTNLLFL